jgi:aspartate kinase
MKPAPILVQKFGGTSVSTADRRARVVEHVSEARDAGFQVVIVVSAMGRRGDPYATDTLLDLLRADGGPVAPDDYDLMFTCGETISVAVMSQALKRAGIPAIGLTAAQARIFTDGRHVEAHVEAIDTARLRALMEDGLVPVVTGGQGVARDTLDYTTLGRGGSDTSGVAVGAALGAARVDIFTDVEGVAVVDPRLVPGARLLRRVSYDAMYELARFGAKVVHPRALVAGRDGGVPVVVRSTFSAAPGTTIADVEDESPIVGIALLPPMETLVLPPGSVDVASREKWEHQRLVMSVADTCSGYVFVGAGDDKHEEMQAAIRELGVEPVRTCGRCCWLSVVGSTMGVREGHARWAARLTQRQVPVHASELSDRRVSYVVPEAMRAAAVTAIHETLAAPSP